MARNKDREDFVDDWKRTDSMLAGLRGAENLRDPEFREVVKEGLLSKADGEYPPEGHGYSRRVH